MFVGPVALPSPLVSPPTESSRHDVNTTGDPADPDATNEPSTVSVTPDVALTIVPGSTVRVAPGAMVTLHVSR